MKRYISQYKELALIVSMVLSIYACDSKKDAKQQHAGEMPALPAEVDSARVSSMSYTFQYPAYTKALKEVELLARVPGYLQEIRYKAGERVKKGTILFVIEPQPYRDNVNTAKASVEQAKANLEYATSNYNRMKQAVKVNGVSELEYLQAKSNFHSADATLKSAMSALNSAEIDLGYCYVRATDDGRVSENQIDVGNYVGAGNNSLLATLYSDEMMYVYFNASYNDYMKIQEGNNRMINLYNPTDTSIHWTGKIDYVAPNVNQSTGSVTYRAIVPNQNASIIDGIYLEVEVPYKRVDQAVVVPESSIITDQSGSYMYTVNDKNKVQKQMVVLGYLNNTGEREIVSGIKAGDIFITKAMINLRVGEEVKPYFKK